MSNSFRPAPLPGKAAPAATFVDLDSGPLSLDALLARADSRPTLLVFFKTSCPVCKLAWPYLQQLHLVRGDAVRVVGVCQNDAASARAFHAEYGKATFPLVLDPEPAFAASNAYGVESVPHHVLIEPDGIVSRVFSGWQKREMEELARQLAEKNHHPFIPVFAEGDPVPTFKPG
ncbi:MAG: TlpA disulfide reductase family protein [Thermoanaerobaculia bacterium]